MYPASDVDSRRPADYRLQLRNTLEEMTEDGPREVDILHWMSRTALELIGRNGLGYSFDPLTADTPDEFATAIKNFT